MGGSETAQQPDKLSHERGGIGRQHVSDGCVTDAVSQCHSVRACPSANGHSSSFGILLPINKECRFDELLVRFRRWVGQSNKKGRRPVVYEREWNKDAAGVIGKLSWHPCRVCFRSCLHAMWLIAVATVGRHSQGAFWHKIFVTAIKGKTMDYKRNTRSEYKRYGWE